METRIIYSEERKTWNVFVDGEWYFESADYEQASEVMFNCCVASYEDDYYDDYEEPYSYESDYYGEY